MRILPVLDLQAGRIVRGRGGCRSEYRPLVSRLTDSCRPLEVARALREQFDFQEFYLADLDAIAGAPPSFNVYSGIRSLGCKLWVDAGVRVPADVDVRLAASADAIVLGLETIEGPGVIANSCTRWGGERFVFSLDLKNGAPLGNLSTWRGSEPVQIAAQAIAAGVRRLLVLDLARVGMNDGTGSEQLCKLLTGSHPGIELTAGGGIRDAVDVHRLHACGASRVLVASALHDGWITRKDLDAMSNAADHGRHS